MILNQRLNCSFPMADIIFLPLDFAPHQSFTGKFDKLIEQSNDDVQIYRPNYEYTDIIPQSQSDQQNVPGASKTFVDFFLLQSTFVPLFQMTKSSTQEKFSVVVKITQKPLFTPHKKIRDTRILLVTDCSVPFPVHLWFRHMDLFDLWDVLFEEDVIGLHNVVWCSKKKAIYSTTFTSLHILNRNNSVADPILKLYVDSFYNL